MRLDERSFADRLGISRTPVREAVARLAREGLVEMVPRKGVFIVRGTRDEIHETFTVWATAGCDRARSENALNAPPRILACTATGQ